MRTVLGALLLAWGVFVGVCVACLQIPTLISPPPTLPEAFLLGFQSLIIAALGVLLLTWSDHR